MLMSTSDAKANQTRNLFISQWRQRLAAGREELREAHENGLPTSQLLHRHSKLVDEILRALWENLELPGSLTLLAVGGYGRGQLYPYSDIDLLFLLPDTIPDELSSALEGLIGLLWDIGLEVGHSVRTARECLEEAAKDVTVQTNLLEARFLAGSRPAFMALTAALLDNLDRRAFFDAKFLEQQQRHGRFHDTAYNLEPNVKESPGGLRDLQNILWISQGARLGRTWKELAVASIITSAEARQIRRHERFLERLRVGLHYLAKRREDKLVFDYQTALAHQLGFVGDGHRRASERLMQQYYRTAKAISQLNEILLQNLRLRIYPISKMEVRPLSPRFRSRGKLLEAVDEKVFEKEPGAILESFLLLQKHPELKGMAAPTLRALWRAKHLIDSSFRRDPRHRAMFMDIIRQPHGITHELRRMNQYGILGRYIPAFGRIVGQMQHDLFHVYTVDEHILMVLRNLRRFTVPEFAHEFPLCSRLINDFDRPEVLFLAALFHDIAKGRGGDHSELGKADARRFCKQHGLSSEDADLVAWLVENHLTMSATAQKQDLSDPEVVAAFADKVACQRRLTALYLLTVADIRGTSPRVWNAWKGKLLEDLFFATQRRLEHAPETPDRYLQRRQQDALDILRLYAVPEEAHRILWARLDVGYFLRHDIQEIAWHTRLLYTHADAESPIVRCRLSPIGEGLQVLIYTRDQDDLFARICNFFDRAGFNIVEAKINTTRHGYALDTFLILDDAPKNVHYRDLISYVEYELADRLRQHDPMEPPVQGRVSRHLKHFPIEPEVAIRPDDRGDYHVLSVVAGDRPGLLYRIARLLVNHQVHLHTAKVNTLGERAEDVFLVTGQGLDDEKSILRLETSLLEELRM